MLQAAEIPKAVSFVVGKSTDSNNRFHFGAGAVSATFSLPACIVARTIKSDHLVASGQERAHHVRADEAGGPGDQGASHGPCSSPNQSTSRSLPAIRSQA